MEMNKYIEPTKEHEGKMIEVRDQDTQNWYSTKLLRVLDPPQRFRFICECNESSELCMKWKLARISVPKTYLDLHKESGLKVGDWVKVTRMAGSREHGWGDVWAARMSECVGKIFQIVIDYGSAGFYLSEAEARFPCFVLEKVEEPAQPTDEIIHVPGTVEHWIYQRHAYRLATESDVGELVYRSDTDFKKAIGLGTRQTLNSVDTKQPMPYTVGVSWKFAYVQDDSLLKPALKEEPKYKYVKFEWGDREIVRGSLIYRDCPGKSRIELRINKIELTKDGIIYFEGWEPSSLLRDWKFMATDEPVGKKVVC